MPNNQVSTTTLSKLLSKENKRVSNSLYKAGFALIVPSVIVAVAIITSSGSWKPITATQIFLGLASVCNQAGFALMCAGLAIGSWRDKRLSNQPIETEQTRMSTGTNNGREEHSAVTVSPITYDQSLAHSIQPVENNSTRHIVTARGAPSSAVREKFPHANDQWAQPRSSQLARSISI